jgi:hypothetical protein
MVSLYQEKTDIIHALTIFLKFFMYLTAVCVLQRQNVSFRIVVWLIGILSKCSRFCIKKIDICSGGASLQETPIKKKRTKKIV